MSSWLLSVITINLNNKQGLAKTINSVVSQTYANIEYIVIDGGSTDGSVDLLDNSGITYCISEKDSGIYQAMNKGIAKATGQYCIFLNSGDYFASPSIVEEAVKLMSYPQSVGIYYGDLIINGCKAGYPTVVSLEFLLKRSLPHPASFFRTALFKPINLGLYNEKYKIVSDWIFFIQAYLKQVRFRKIDLPISVYNTEGVSSTNIELNNLERQSVMETLFPNLITDLEDLREMHLYRSSRAHRTIKQLSEWLNSKKVFR